MGVWKAALGIGLRWNLVRKAAMDIRDRTEGRPGHSVFRRLVVYLTNCLYKETSPQSFRERAIGVKHSHVPVHGTLRPFPSRPPLHARVINGLPLPLVFTPEQTSVERIHCLGVLYERQSLTTNPIFIFGRAEGIDKGSRTHITCPSTPVPLRPTYPRLSISERRGNLEQSPLEF